jgi:EAL domain-containing protein (putative c-di-GMP-specific phosphodiesterase class I)
MSYLTQLVVDELKIDRSFVSGMASDPKRAAIVRAVIELAHALGASVTAEGVEDGMCLQVLRSL